MTTRKPQARKLSRKVSARDHSRGSPLARVTLVAYGDFAAPGCAQTYRTIKKIQKEMGTLLRYVYRSFPEPGKFRQSEEAAEAAECAAAQGKFWEMHDALFESKGAGEVRFHQKAAEAGLDVLRFRREMRSRAHARRVRGVRESGVRSGVGSAPAFFINSVRHQSSFGLATLLAAVQAATGGEGDPGENEKPVDLKSRGKR